MLNIKVVLASVREGRLGEKPAAWILEKAKARKEFAVELVDLKDYSLPVFNEPQVPAMISGNYPNEAAKQWAAKIGEADGFIFVTPEYNHGYPSSLKNAIDYIYGEWVNKPVAFVSYGADGGVRAVEQLKQVVNSNLQMHPVPAVVSMARPWDYLNEQGVLDTTHFEKAGDTMLDQLAWLGEALKAARK